MGRSACTGRARSSARSSTTPGSRGRPSQQLADTFVEVSREQLGLADADLLFYASYGEDGAADAAAVVGGPLWSGLPVVAAGNAHPVSDDLWNLGIGPIASGLVLDDLARYAP